MTHGGKFGRALGWGGLGGVFGGLGRAGAGWLALLGSSLWLLRAFL